MAGEETTEQLLHIMYLCKRFILRILCSGHAPKKKKNYPHVFLSNVFMHVKSDGWLVNSRIGKSKFYIHTYQQSASLFRFIKVTIYSPTGVEPVQPYQFQSGTISCRPPWRFPIMLTLPPSGSGSGQPV